MPHTGSILHGRYAVVSCHVERPLDDEAWKRFSALQTRRPGRFVIAALMRPPAPGEDEELWLERAREGQARGPLGLHTDCTATAFRPDYLEPGAAHLQLRDPTWLQLPSGRKLLELPTTHSIGMLARGVLGPFRRRVVHAYFHDTDLLDPRRRAALTVGLAILRLRRTAIDLGELQRGLRPAKTTSFANSRA